MAEPVSDWKDRDFAPSTLPRDGELTYPEPAAIDPVVPELPGTPTGYDVDGEKGRHATQSNARLNSAAEKIGGALGSARNIPGKMKSRLQVVGGRNAPGAASGGVADEASERVAEWKDAASDKLQDLKETASDKMDDLRSRASDWSVIARDRVIDARRRANYYANEYPLQTIAALAGLAFCVGFILRVWRANSD